MFFFKSHHHIIRHRCFVFKIVVQSAWNMFHFIYSTLSWQHINRIQISSKQLRCSNLLSSIVHSVLYVLCNTCTLSWVLFIFVWSHQNGHVKDGRVHRSNNCHRVIGFVFRFFFFCLIWTWIDFIYKIHWIIQTERWFFLLLNAII